jgi:hypothetical protein
MPRKGAAAAAPKTTENAGSEETMAEVTYNESVAEPAQEETKPARRGRKTAEERAAEREADNATYGADQGGGLPDGGVEDWTKPEYADDPGEFEFGSLDDDDEFLSIMWWGKEGTGKTTNLARVAATKLAPVVKGNVLMINAEGGAKRTPLRKHGIDTSRFKTYPQPGQQLTFEGLERLYYRLAADLDADPDSWGAVCWDSITAIHEKLLDNVIEADMRKQAEILQRAKKTRGGRSGNITMRDRFETDGDDYGQMTSQVKLLLRKYSTLPCHFLVTALERRDEDKKRKGSKPQYGPAVTPALSTALLGYVDIVIRTHVLDENVYYGRTTPTEDSRGKDRLNSLPVELVDPTFDRIYAYVHGELQHETDRTQRRMPNGAEGVLVRRSLADDDGPWSGPTADGTHHTKDGTPDGPPLAGDEDDPEPPKRSGRRKSGASSGRGTASAPESATEEDASSEPDSPATEPEAAVDPPKRSGRRRSGGASSTPAADASPIPDEPATAEEPEQPKRSGRKSAADRAAAKARTEVKADTEPAKSGPATKAATERAAKAQQASGFNDEPPF